MVFKMWEVVQGQWRLSTSLCLVDIQSKFKNPNLVLIVSRCRIRMGQLKYPKLHEFILTILCMAAWHVFSGAGPLAGTSSL